MLIAAVLTLCAAVATAALAVWTLTRTAGDDPNRPVLRAVAPTQLAAAVMLAAGAAVALTAPGNVGVLVLVICLVGAVGTVGAGCYQSAKAVARHEARVAPAAACAGACASCTLSCG